VFQICVTGGKGGTGKSFIAANLAYGLARLIGSKLKIILADLDVEAPNDHYILGEGRLASKEDIEIYFPKIDYSKCTGCGACAKVCDTGAIVIAPGKPPFVFPRLCSGCKACYYACPYKAISPNSKRVVGYIEMRDLAFDGSSIWLVTGILREGEEHTPPAVVATKRRAVSLSPDVLIVDTGAGTGNAISAAIQGSNLVIAVTEPTPLGLHDLEAILKIVRGMGYRLWVVINRYGIGPAEKHRELAKKYGAERIYEVPFSRKAVESYVNGVPLLRYAPDDPAARVIDSLVKDVVEEINSILEVRGYAGS